MKIQVSFDRTTKKEFRDICVQRLKNFVEQIKHNENSKSKENHIIQLKQHLQMHKNQSQSQRQQQSNVSLKQAPQVLLQIPRDSRTSRKENKTQEKNNRNAEPESVQKIQKQETKNRKKTAININMCQIKQNLSKIMQKFEKQHRETSMKNKELEQKVQTTNQKLDMLIEELTKKRLIGQTEAKTSFQQSQAERQCFMQKFNQLEAKYNAIKHNSLSNSSYRHSANKSVYSMQQTSDSLTFRKNF